MRAWATLESCSGCPAPPCRYASAVFSINLRLLRWGGGSRSREPERGHTESLPSPTPSELTLGVRQPLLTPPPLSTRSGGGITSV